MGLISNLYKQTKINKTNEIFNNINIIIVINVIILIIKPYLGFFPCCFFVK